MATPLFSFFSCASSTSITKFSSPSPYIPSHFRPGLNPLTTLGFLSKLPTASKCRSISSPISKVANFGMPPLPLYFQKNSNSVRLSATVSDSSPTTTASPSCPPSMLNNAEYLENEFGSRGLRFSSVGDMCAVEMTVENGSRARLMLPSGLITSYKPLMWHGGCVEMLHTIVASNLNQKSGASLQGGIGLVLNNLNHTAQDECCWSARDWAVQSVSAKPEDAIQVTLRCCNDDGMLSIRYVVTLYDKLLTTAVLVDNISSSPIEMTSSIMTHLSLSTPDGAFAIGLRGCSYCIRPPLLSEFCIVSSVRDQSKPSSGWSFLQHLFRIKEKSCEREQPATGDSETESIWVLEKDDFAHLRNKMSRVYSTPRSEIRLNDRGKRYTLILQKVGFEEFYLSSPGSNSKLYGKQCYICTGPASMLQPVVLNPGEHWRAAQVLQNPNI